MNKKVLDCSYCHTTVDDSFSCKSCKSSYHKECYKENGGCSVLGCNNFAKDKSSNQEINKEKIDKASLKSKVNNSSKKQVNNHNEVKKSKKNNKVLVFVLFILFIPFGYSVAYFNLFYPILPALYSGDDIKKAYSDGVKEGEESGFTKGYSSGELDGYNQGYKEGEDDGYSSGFKKGDSSGYNRGYSVGDKAGYARGFELGEDSGYDSGYKSGRSAGYLAGYRVGLTDGCESVFESLGYTRVVGYSYSYWSGSSYGRYTLNKSSC